MHATIFELVTLQSHEQRDPGARTQRVLLCVHERVLTNNVHGIRCVVCGPGLVHIFDRYGQRVDEISLQGNGMILSLDWDVDGESLAVLQEGNGVIPLWDSSSRTTTSIDTNLKDPTFMAWSDIGPQLVVGTAKGNILMYNKTTRKKIPVLGKHPRRITCGAWSDTNQLVLGSSDNTLTVSNDTGDTLEQSQVKRPPTAMCFVGTRRAKGSRPSSAREKTLTVEASGSVVAVNLSGKSLLLYTIGDPDRPIELAFQQKYGDIVVHRAFGENCVLVGFSEVRHPLHVGSSSTSRCLLRTPSRSLSSTQGISLRLRRMSNQLTDRRTNGIRIDAAKKLVVCSGRSGLPILSERCALIAFLASQASPHLVSPDLTLAASR